MLPKAGESDYGNRLPEMIGVWPTLCDELRTAILVLIRVGKRAKSPSDTAHRIADFGRLCKSAWPYMVPQDGV